MAALFAEWRVVRCNSDRAIRALIMSVVVTRTSLAACTASDTLFVIEQSIRVISVRVNGQELG